MSVANRLFYDPTDANTIAASSTIGAYTLGADGTPISQTGGALDVNVASGSFSSNSDYAEDSAHTTGDEGKHLLAVRQDTLASSTNADNDYGSVKANAKGEIYMKDTDVLAALAAGVDISDGGGSITVDAAQLDIDDLNATDDAVAAWAHDGTGTAITSTGGALDVNIASGATIDLDDSLADTAIENTATAVSLVAVNVVSSALPNRKWLYLANNDNKELFFGKTGVTVANGFPMGAQEKFEFRIGPSVTPQIIGGPGSSNQDLRVMELS